MESLNNNDLNILVKKRKKYQFLAITQIILFVIFVILIIFFIIIPSYRTPDEIDFDFYGDLPNTTFNEKFEQYEGTNIRGKNVNSLLRTVLRNNLSDNNRKIEITGNVLTLGKNDKKLPRTVNPNKTFNVKCEYFITESSEKIVQRIIITENETTTK